LGEDFESPDCHHKHMARHSIEQLSVTGGFLDGVSIELADGLNRFIGARGTGKTTALEFLRCGLNRMPDPKVDKDRKHGIEKLVEESLARGSLAISIRTCIDYETARPHSGLADSNPGRVCRRTAANYNSFTQSRD
jgi:ABC-type uncharacterized transport system ATPase subunit